MKKNVLLITNGPGVAKFVYSALGAHIHWLGHVPSLDEDKVKKVFEVITFEDQQLALVIIGAGAVSPVGKEVAVERVAWMRQHGYVGPVLFASGTPSDNQAMAKEVGDNAFALDSPADFRAKALELLNITV